MATELPSRSNADEEEEDYIDMELTSSSPPQNREFEFQMSSISREREPINSPADELFYKGKLLPLHLPPRVQMVRNLLLLQTPSKTAPQHSPVQEENRAPSPSESCRRLSTEMNPDEYFFEWSTELTSFISDHPKKSWSKRLKLIKKSSIGQKIRSSRTYLRSLFSKSSCSSDKSCAKEAAGNGESEIGLSKYIKVDKKNNPLGQTKGATQNHPPTIRSVLKGIEDEVSSHRKSFSGAIKRHSPAKCLSSASCEGSSSGDSSSSSSSSASFSFGFYELQFLKRSSSDTSDMEGSIAAAIAHCKNSQELFNPRNQGVCSI